MSTVASDILARLRGTANDSPGTEPAYWNVMSEAAEEIERLRALVGVQREDVARDLIQEVLNHSGTGFSRKSAAEFMLLPHALAENGWFKRAQAFLHTEQPQEGYAARTIEAAAKIAEEMTACIRPYVRSDKDELIPCKVAAAIRALSASPASPRAEDGVTFCYVTYRACTASCPSREECALGKVMARIDAAPVAEKRGEP